MNNQSQIASQKVFSLFQQYRNRPFVFVESGGNYGDFLIYRGAQKLAKQAGVNFRTINHQDLMSQTFSAETVIYMHGGGGFNDYWRMDPIKEFGYLLANHPGVVIVGPQAFYIRNPQALEEFRNILRVPPKSEKVYFFTRGNYSFNVLKEFVPSWIELQADHDTAFNLSAEDFKTEPHPKNYTLYAIRQDVEKAPIKSSNPFILWFDPIADCKSFDEWVRVHQHAGKILTNRLHSAILGSLLGKNVTILPNSYFKNKCVWEFSLQSRGVLWLDNLEHKSFPILEKISGSYKLRQFVKKMYGVR